ncbi:MAG TPA: META domain-containing protein [Pyrinomonadaceae bacterium]|jgi:heat shock protein HslJ
MKAKLLSSIVFIILVSIAAAAQDRLSDRNWRLTYLSGVKIGQAHASISIDRADGRFTGNTGCNIMNGTVRVTRNSIKFNAVMTTKRMCIVATAPVESGMLSGLNSVDRFQVSRDRLRLYNGNRLLMEFEPVVVPKPKPDDGANPSAGKLGLEDGKWYLTSIAGSPIPKVQEDAYISFHLKEGSAGGDTSCNVFGGNIETTGDKFSFTQGISTMRACIEDERMDIERQFLDGLRRANRYEIRGESLMLYHDRKLLLTFVGR